MFTSFLVGLLWLYLAFIANTSGFVQAAFWINIVFVGALLGFIAGGFAVPSLVQSMEATTLIKLAKSGPFRTLLKLIDVAIIAVLVVTGMHWIAAGWAVLFVLALYIHHAAASELFRRVEASKDPA